MENRGHERTPLNLEEMQKHSRKPVRAAPDVPGQHLSGRLEAVAYDRENRQHAVAAGAGLVTDCACGLGRPHPRRCSLRAGDSPVWLRTYRLRTYHRGVA